MPKTERGSNQSRTEDRPAHERGRRTEPRDEIRPGLRRREDEPPLAEDLDLKRLPRPIQAELRGLPEGLAEVVGSHLLMAGELLDTDPTTAFAHADAARRRASRLPVVRQVAGETAYAAGEYAAALNEFRALKRMTGTADFVALAADCERGLGRPQAALTLVREGLAGRPTTALRAELRIVEAGARADLGQLAEALRVLQEELESASGPAAVRARLAYAYADLIGKAGDEQASLHWFQHAASLDTAGDTDAADRVDELQGMKLEIDFDLLDDDADSDDQPDEGSETAAVPDAVAQDEAASPGSAR